MISLTVQSLILLSILMILLSTLSAIVLLTLSVIRQKGESQNGGNKKTKQVKFSEKRTFLSPWYPHVRVHQGGKKCPFFRKFGMLCFLVTSILRLGLVTAWDYFWTWNSTLTMRVEIESCLLSKKAQLVSLI